MKYVTYLVIMVKILIDLKNKRPNQTQISLETQWTFFFLVVYQSITNFHLKIIRAESNSKFEFLINLKELNQDGGVLAESL